MRSLTLKRGLLWLSCLGIAGAIGLGLLIFADSRSNALQLRPLVAAAPTTPGFLKETISYTVNGKRIAADLYRPDGSPPHGYVVFLHGNRPDGRKHPLPSGLCSNLGRRYVVLAFDYPGYGDSDPMPPYRPGMVLDFQPETSAAITYLEQRFAMDPQDVILMGHSLGSVSVLDIGHRISAKLIIAIGAADAQQVISTELKIRGEVRKYQKIGLDVPPDAMQTLYSPFFADNMLARCYPVRVVLISGEFDRGLTGLDPYVSDLNGRCPHTIERIIVPWANHMFWSERRYKRQLWLKLQTSSISESDWTLALTGAVVQAIEGADHS